MRLAPARGWFRAPGRHPRTSWRATAARLRGPLYAVDGAGVAWQGGFGRSGSGRATAVSASVVHVVPGGELDVDTSDEPPWGASDVEDHRLTGEWLHRALRPDGIAFPLTITAERWERDVLVDGQPTPFVFVGDDTTWCASGTVHDRQVRVSATGWPQDRLALVAIMPGEVAAEVPTRP